MKKVLFPLTTGICLTIDGQPCVNVPWKWSEGPRNFAHYVNCIPMTGEGAIYKLR